MNMKKTKADVPPPPPRNKGAFQKAEFKFGDLLEAPPAANAPPLPVEQLIDDNMGQGKPVRDLNFLVPVDFHRAFKAEALKRDLKMKDMLYLMFRQWTHDHPVGHERRSRKVES